MHNSSNNGKANAIVDSSAIYSLFLFHQHTGYLTDVRYGFVLKPAETSSQRMVPPHPAHIREVSIFNKYLIVNVVTYAANTYTS